MPEHGLAVTLPDEWLAFDLTTDLDAQVDALDASIGHGISIRSASLKARLHQFAAMHDDAALLGFPLSVGEACILSAIPVWMSLHDPRARGQVEAMLRDTECVIGDGDFMDLGLPAGSAVVVHVDHECEGQDSERTLYSIVFGDRAAELTCDASTRPDEDWLSIAETIEFLPEEQ